MECYLSTGTIGSPTLHVYLLKKKKKKSLVWDKSCYLPQATTAWSTDFFTLIQVKT